MASLSRAAIVATTLLSDSASAVKLGSTVLAANEECGNITMSFERFVEKYGRSYRSGSDEYKMRRAIFDENTARVDSHNCAPKGPWAVAINHLADWTPDEMKALHGYKPSSSSRSSSVTALNDAGATLGIEDPDTQSYPDDVSWGNLTSIKTSRDQGQCGSCWAFGAETVLRARAEIKKRSFDFSVSQLVACVPNPNECGGQGGCEGATVEVAYEYFFQAGSASDSTFSYPPGGGQKACPREMRFPAGPGDAVTSMSADGVEEHRLAPGATGMKGATELGMTGWSKLPENKELPVIRALVEGGPVAIAVAAGADWSFYSKGVLTKEGCDRNNVINHAVVLYGYGKGHHQKIGEVKYWRIKNSWGETWGEDGSLRLQRLDNEEEYCGWDNQPEVGVGCKGGPAKVWVCGSCGILYDVVAAHFSSPDGTIA